MRIYPQREGQLTLAGLIIELERVRPTYASCFTGTELDEHKHVNFDFCNTFPSKPHSFRGSYEELAIGWEFDSYDSKGKRYKPPTVTEFIATLKGCIGQSFEGWKGGDYVMQPDTPVWVDNRGISSLTAITGVSDDSCFVYIITKRIEF